MVVYGLIADTPSNNFWWIQKRFPWKSASASIGRAHKTTYWVLIPTLQRTRSFSSELRWSVSTGNRRDSILIILSETSAPSESLLIGATYKQNHSLTYLLTPELAYTAVHEFSWVRVVWTRLYESFVSITTSRVDREDKTIISKSSLSSSRQTTSSVCAVEVTWRIPTFRSRHFFWVGYVV